jgi:hypothetical protein
MTTSRFWHGFANMNTVAETKVVMRSADGLGAAIDEVVSRWPGGMRGSPSSKLMTRVRQAPIPIRDASYSR